MFEVREKPDLVEKAMLVGFCFDKSEEDETRLLLTELEELVDTLGIGIVGIELVRVRDTNKRFICGTGKADELVELARALKHVPHVRHSGHVPCPDDAVGTTSLPGGNIAVCIVAGAIALCPRAIC